MRLFTGIGVDENALPHLAAALKDLRASAKVNWSRPENLHITTKFIGEWAEDRLAELERALAAVPWPGPLQVEITGLGFLPNARRPHVFYAAVQPADELAAIARATEDALEALGCPREDRRFKPHITIARLGERPIGRLPEAVAAISGPLGWFEATGFHLYRSKPAPHGSVYTKLASYP